MLQGVSHKFRSGCLMLCRQQGESLTFLGTSFLVHHQGYLMTAAHLVDDPKDLAVVPAAVTDEFIPLMAERVAAMPVQVVATDTARDVALLRLEQEIDIDVPYDFLGATDSLRSGASLMSLGYSFGHQQVQNLLGYNAVVSAKVRSPNGTALIFYDAPFHEGDRGGPLVHVTDGHIIGIISGRFDPVDFVHPSGTELQALDHRESNVSYAVAIEYALDLMREAGLSLNTGVSE